jgi:GT2 family glycosyltransferase
MPELAVLIPTCCDDPARLHLAHTLSTLALQELPFDRVRVVVRDEGHIKAMTSDAVRLTLNLLARKGLETVYVPAASRKGIAYARCELVERFAGTADLVLFLDDDMIVEPGCIRRLWKVLAADQKAGFVQGAKVELNAARTYWNDINEINDASSGEPKPIVFGDAALLLLRRRALDAVNWDVVTRFSVEGLAGEDVAMTLMIADRYPAWGAPDARAWHLSPSRERWRWEPASDLLQVQLLKEVVSKETLSRALPHLRSQIDEAFGPKGE